MKENYRWSSFENDAEIPQKNWLQKQSGRIVLNNRYLGYWPSIGNAYAYRVDHNSIVTMTRDNQERALIHSPPDYQLLNICYQGFEQATFEEQMKLFPDKIRWEAVKKDINIYEIYRFLPYMHDKSKPDAIWTIDGNKGFLVSERISFTKDGNIYECIKADITASRYLGTCHYHIFSILHCQNINKSLSFFALLVEIAKNRKSEKNDESFENQRWVYAY